MGWKGMLVLGALLLLGADNVSASVITIDKEPVQLVELRKAYEAELKTAATPEDIATTQEEYEQAKKNLSAADGYGQKLSSLEAAKQKEIEAINGKYLKEQAKLDASTRKAIEERFEKKLAELKNRGVAKTSNSYQAKLEKLEKELVGKNDLAGALVVQVERQKMSGAPVAAIVKTASSAGKGNAVHVSSVRGLAGAAGNIANNIYVFTLDRIGSQAKLVFYGYGNRTGDSHGKVYLLGPDGSRTEVAQWQPDLLRGPKVSDFKSYTDVQPISADISSQVKQPGQYRVEFQYTDGDEAFNIYRVEIQI
jgi:hypothetical protein